MSEPNSYRTILRSSSIIGGASALNILVGLIRNKAVAVILGPSGLGIVGLLLNLMQTASTLAALGLGTAGTRQIAEAAAKGDQHNIARTRRALFWGTVGLAATGAVIFYLLRHVLAAQVLHDPLSASTIGWLSLGVMFTVASGSQQALLNGMRRIGDIARIQVGSAVLSAVVGLAALMAWGVRGIAIFIIAAPLATFILGHLYARRVERIAGAATTFGQLSAEWRAMLRLGLAFMVSGLVLTVGNLIVRSMVQRDLGAASLGQFQAAWTISMTYIAFVLSAMAADYYPRLTGVIDKPDAAARLVNEQTEVALLLAGPVFIAMLATAPWVIKLLYTSEFSPAAEVLRWQVVGDILKVASWPLGFVLVAAGAGRTYILTETLAVVVLVLGTAFGLPRFGVVATGFSFVLMYAVYLIVQFYLARRRIGMSWTVTVKAEFALVIVLAAVVMVLAYTSQTLAAAIGLLSATGFGLFSLARLSAMAKLSLPGGGIVAIGRRWLRHRDS